MTNLPLILSPCLLLISACSGAATSTADNDSVTAISTIDSISPSVDTTDMGDTVIAADEVADTKPEEDAIKAAKLKQGIIGEVIISPNHTFNLYKDHRIHSYPSDGDWQKYGEIITIFTGEGTSYITIINGFAYDGYYDPSTGECCYEDWVGDEESGGLENVCYKPTPSKGEKAKVIWYK